MNGFGFNSAPLNGAVLTGQVQQGAANFPASSSLGAAWFCPVPVALAITANAALSSTVTRTQKAAAALLAVSTLLGTGKRTTQATAAFSAVSGVSATGSLRSTLDFTAASTFVAAGKARRGGVAAVAASAALAVTANREARLTTNLSATVSFTAPIPTIKRGASASMQAGAAFLPLIISHVSATLDMVGGVDFWVAPFGAVANTGIAATSAFGAVAVRHKMAIAAAQATSTLPAVVARKAVAARSALYAGAAAIMTANQGAVNEGVLSFPCPSSMSGLGHREARGNVAFGPQATLSLAPVPLRAVSASAVGTTSMFVSAQGLVLVFAALSGASTLSPNAYRTTKIQAAVAAGSALTAATRVTKQGVILAEAGVQVSALALRTRHAAAYLLSASTAAFAVAGISRYATALGASIASVIAEASISPSINFATGSFFNGVATRVRTVEAAVLARATGSANGVQNRAGIVALRGGAGLGANAVRQQMAQVQFRSGGALILVYQPTRFAGAVAHVAGGSALGATTFINTGAMPPRSRQILIPARRPAVQVPRPYAPIRVT